MKRILTGLQPSGELTLGSLLGGIKQSITYQDKYESFIFVPDMHAITVPQDADILRERIKKNVALYIACGIDPNKNTIYIQSENLYHANLSWILECNAYMGESSRMTQYKDKSKKFQNIPVGLFTYPILMASDILLYSADYVPVGIDQKQHVELCRNLAIRFNNKYGTTFTIPEAMIPKMGAKIMDLQDPTKKMSKSSENHKGIIFLTDDEATVMKKIKSAVTDSESKIYYDTENKPGISNLLVIYASLKDISLKEAEKHFKDYNYGNFKIEVANTLNEKLSTIQNKYQEIINTGEIDKILDKGREVTEKIAKEKYNEVINKVGLGRGNIWYI